MNRLKLSKTSWLILSAGVFIIVVGTLGFTLSQKVDEQIRLEDELSIAEMRIGQMKPKTLQEQEKELQAELDEVLIQLSEAKDSLRQTVESIDVTDKFFAVARSCNVGIKSISSSNIKDTKVNDIDCSLITINAVAEGEVPDLISFVIKLNNDFTTGVVDTAQITVPPG